MHRKLYGHSTRPRLQFLPGERKSKWLEGRVWRIKRQRFPDAGTQVLVDGGKKKKKRKDGLLSSLSECQEGPEEGRWLRFERFDAAREGYGK